MISVKDALNTLDRQVRSAEEKERQVKRCLTLWQQSMGAVEEHIFPLFPEAARQAEEDWQQVRICLCEDTQETVLETAPRLVERVLRNYAQQSRRTQAEDMEALKAILEVMAATASSARSRTRSYGGGVENVCERLARMAQGNDLEKMRQELTREAAELREEMSRMLQENEESVAALEGEVRQFRERLAKAEEAASTDGLTGLANRRELERQLELRIQQMRPFCALLFDLDDFKSINDRFGHDAGDEVLRRFAAVLNEQVRPGDVVARWGGDEYFVIFDCQLKDAMRRCRQIAGALSRRYEITVEGKAIAISIRASSGVVEYVPGERASDLFRRADQAMYATKARQIP